jgi:hypothetical protein
MHLVSLEQVEDLSDLCLASLGQVEHLSNVFRDYRDTQ